MVTLYLLRIISTELLLPCGNVTLLIECCEGTITSCASRADKESSLNLSLRWNVLTNTV